MFPHFDGMISPVPDPDARGAFLNLSLHHTRADMYRATLEALGYTLAENIELFLRCGFPSEPYARLEEGPRVSSGCKPRQTSRDCPLKGLRSRKPQPWEPR